MEEKTSIEILNEKVGQILHKYNELKSENEMMRNELITLRSQSEIKDVEIERLTEENSMKDLEIEEIVNKIESILS
jgi:hypothetical protein